MKQIIKNKVTHKNRLAAADSLFYNVNPLAPSHDAKGVSLTERRTRGLSNEKNFLRDLEHLRAAYRFQNRFTPGRELSTLDGLLMITDAPGVKFSAQDHDAAAVSLFASLGPGVMAAFNVHVQSKPGKTGEIPGPDGNYTLAHVRKLGPFLIRRIHAEKSEYRLLKVSNELFRLVLQTTKGVYFPDTDEQRAEARKAQHKKTRAEELSEKEWTRVLAAAKGNKDHPALDFASANSVLQSPESAIKALMELRYEFEPQELPASLDDKHDPLAGHFFTICHPDWDKKRVSNAKKPVKPNAQRPKMMVDMVEVLCEARQLVRTMQQRHIHDLAEARRKAVKDQESALSPAAKNRTETRATPAPQPDATTKATVTPEPANPPKPGFQNDEYLIPMDLITAVEALPPRQILQDVHDASEVLSLAGWPVSKEYSHPNELVLEHGGQTIRVRQDAAMFAIQTAILRKYLQRSPDWSKHADLQLSTNLDSGKTGPLHVYLACFHPDLRLVQEKLDIKANQFNWIRISEYTGRGKDPIQTAANFLKLCGKRMEPQLLVLFMAIHFRTSSTGFLSFEAQVRQRLTRNDLPEPAFTTTTPPPPIPRKDDKAAGPPIAPKQPEVDKGTTPLELALGHRHDAPEKSNTAVEETPIATDEAGITILPPWSPLTDHEWENEQAVLAWLQRQAIAHYLCLKKSGGTNPSALRQKLLSALGLEMEATTRKGKSGPIQGAKLSRNGKSIIVSRYRFLFVIESGFTWAACASLGLTMPPPSQPTEPISEQDQETAQKFWGLQFLGSSLWAETRDKLQSPQMKKALSDVWPEICQEPDEEQKAKHLLGVLKLTGKCAAFDHVRLAFAILDPLACRFSDVGPKVMGIEKDCQPRPGEKIVR